MIMINLYTNFHIPSRNASLVIHNNVKAKYVFRSMAILLFY